MSETTTETAVITTETTAPKPEDTGGNSGFTPPATQEELNRIIADRISREKAKFADYNDLKTKATQFDELAEAQKSETQKALERAEAAERALAETQSEKLRLSVIAKHSIPEEYQEFVSGATEEELLAKVEKVKSLIPPAAVVEPPVIRELYVGGEGHAPAPPALNSDALETALKSKLGIS